jgi:hypothetical protein
MKRTNNVFLIGTATESQLTQCDIFFRWKFNVVYLIEGQYNSCRCCDSTDDCGKKIDGRFQTRQLHVEDSVNRTRDRGFSLVYTKTVENKMFVIWFVCVLWKSRWRRNHSTKLSPPENNTAVCHSVTTLSYGCIMPGRRYVFFNLI